MPLAFGSKTKFAVASATVIVAVAVTFAIWPKSPIEGARRLSKCMSSSNSACALDFACDDERASCGLNKDKLRSVLEICFDTKPLDLKKETVIISDDTSASISVIVANSDGRDSALGFTVNRTGEGLKVNGLVISAFVTGAALHRIPAGSPLPKGLEREKMLLAFLRASLAKLEATGVRGVWSYQSDGILRMTWREYEKFLTDRVRKFSGVPAPE